MSKYLIKETVEHYHLVEFPDDVVVDLSDLEGEKFTERFVESYTDDMAVSEVEVSITEDFAGEVVVSVELVEELV